MSAPRRFQAIGLLLALLAGCGDEGMGPAEQIPSTIFVANAPVALNAVGQTLQLDVTVYDQDGLEIAAPTTTYVSNVMAVATVDNGGLVTAVGHGNATITVQSGPATRDVQVSVELASVPLQDGEAVTLSGPVLSQQFFTFEVPAGDDRRFLEIRISGGSGDADIRVRHGERPTVDLFDCASLNAGNYPNSLDFCALSAPDPGTWHIQVMGVFDFAGVELQARLLDPMQLQNGVAVTDLGAPTSGILYFTLDVPPSAAPTSGPDRWSSGFGAAIPGTLDIETEGGSGDADLFATGEGLFELDIITSLPCSSIRGASSAEMCTVTNPSEGIWSIAIVGYQAFNGVSLTATFAPPGSAP